MSWNREASRVFLRERQNAIISGGPPVAKALDENGSDGEERRLGEQTGLDTRVVPAVNSANYVLRILRECAVPERRC